MVVWWKELQVSRGRERKNLNMEKKFKKIFRSKYLPSNYCRSLYHRLLGLCKGSKSVQYAKEFGLLMLRNIILEDEEQYGTHYIVGLCTQIQDVIAM